MITEPAIATALHDLVAEGSLSAEQAARVAERLAASPGPSSDQRSPEPAQPAGATRSRWGTQGRLAEVAGYAGGALLLGAGALFLTDGWQHLSDRTRALSLTGLAVLLIVAGAVIAIGNGSVRELGRTHDSARRRLVSVLATFAAACAAGAAGLVVEDYELAISSAAGLVVVGLGYALVPSAVGQFGAWLASIGVVTGLIDEIGDEPGGTTYGVALVALGAVWVGLAVAHVLREHELGLALGAGLALVAAQLPLIDDNSTLGYAVTAAVSVAGFAGYLSTRSWSVLGVGVLAMTLVVPEAVHDWTDGSVSSAGSLLLAGLTLLAASAIGLRLRHEAV
jgi:hypothetical protein